MRRTACAMMIVGALAGRVSAAEPPLYSPAASYQPPSSTFANGHGHAIKGACGACGDGQLAGQCRDSRRAGDRLNKLIDFLLYRPTPGCDCCPQLTSYVPPLHAWFPPCCHANGADGCATCDKCGLKKKLGHGDCATCAGTAGVPVQVADTKPELIEKKPTLPTRPLSNGIPMTMVRPQPPAATRYWMPGVPSSSERPTPYAPSTSQSNDGNRIQPSNYLPPLPQR